MKKKATIWAIVMLIPLMAAFCGGVNERLIGYTDEVIIPAAETVTDDGGPGIDEILYSVGNVYSFLEKNFLYEIDNEKIEEALLSGLIEGLGDQYSYYVPEEESNDFNEGITGEYVGVGTYVNKMNPKFADFSDPETYMLNIVSPFPGGPADRAGLRPGDRISHINGEDLSGMDAYEASRKLRGKAGESLTLTVHRGSSSFELELMPEKVTTPNSIYTMIDGNIGYLFIQTFNQMSTKSITEALESMLADGMDRLIIDLRNNAGGTVNTCLEIIDLFQKGGTMVTVEYSENSNKPSVSYQAGMKTLVPEDMPIIILVNGGSASASEIMTGALMDTGRAKVMGAQTFGKGIMQDIIPYKGGFISFTVAHYLTPDGSDIHEKGITPQIIIEDPEYTDEEMDAYEAFMKEGKYINWVDEHPEYSFENIESFAEANKDTGVPHDILCILVRNEYYYRMPVFERPVVDLDYDIQLQAAIEEIKE